MKRAGIRIPQLNPSVNIQDANTLFGLAERTVAVQSTLFLQDTFNYIKPHLQAYLPKSQDRLFLDFCSEIETIPEFLNYMNRYFASKAMRWDDIINQISNTKWDMKEMPEMLGSNPYVTSITREWNTFDARFKLVSTRVGIPKKVQQDLYFAAAKYTMEAIVEGFSRIRRCTDPGRTQMNLDVTTLRRDLEQFVKPVPTDFAMNYAKAIYETEDRIQKWCKDHPEYTLRQWTSVVNLGPGPNMKKANRDTLTRVLNELDQLRKLAVTT